MSDRQNKAQEGMSKQVFFKKGADGGYKFLVLHGFFFFYKYISIRLEHLKSLVLLPSHIYDGESDGNRLGVKCLAMP